MAEEKEEHTHEHAEHKKHTHASKDTLTIKKKDLWKAGGIIAALLAIVALSAALMGKTGINLNTGYTGDKAELDFYVMSQCPYGTQVMDAIAPVIKQLGGALDFEVNYIASDLGNGAFNSLHGENEVKGDIAQLCAAKYEPDKYLDMIVCQDENAGAIPGNWESCAKVLDNQDRKKNLMKGWDIKGLK